MNVSSDPKPSEKKVIDLTEENINKNHPSSFSFSSSSSSSSSYSSSSISSSSSSCSVSSSTGDSSRGILSVEDSKGSSSSPYTTSFFPSINKADFFSPQRIGVPKMRGKPHLVDADWILNHIPWNVEIKQETDASYIVLTVGPTIYHRILNAPSHCYLPIFRWYLAEYTADKYPTYRYFVVR
jgi:hypothetical protein